MNNHLIKEIYRAALFAKISMDVHPDNLDKFIENFSDIEKILKDNNVLFNTDNALKYYMFKYNNTVFISFFSSLSYNKNDQQKKYKDNIYIHKGALEQYQNIEDTLYKNILDLDYNKGIKKLYVCGYHIGGSVATIASAILGEKYRNIYLVSCFTFGAPKIGNRDFKDYFQRYVTCNYRMVINVHHPDEGFNCYNYHKYIYNQYNHFKDRNYYHTSDALQIENDNIIEFKQPKLKKLDKIFRHFYVDDEKYFETAIKLELYIQRLESIIAMYKENMLKLNSPKKSSSLHYYDDHKNIMSWTKDAVTSASTQTTQTTNTEKSRVSQIHSDNCYIKIIEERLDRLNETLDKLIVERASSSFILRLNNDT
jgi:hypothetical protein